MPTKILYDPYSPNPKQPDSYTYSVVEGALCIWDEITNHAKITDTGPIKTCFENFGSFEMRAMATALAVWGEPIWTLGHTGPCVLDGVQFDWEVCPALVSLATFNPDNGQLSVPSGTTAELLLLLLEKLQ